MAKPLDPNALVTLEELAISNMLGTDALVEVLEKKGYSRRRAKLELAGKVPEQLGKTFLK